MASKTEEVVCVTGGSGFIGSWVVRQLLQRGYTVRATVQDLKNEKETKHLQDLEGAEFRLSLFQIDLFDYDSIAAAVRGCAGVFHLASPVFEGGPDPQKRILEPAIAGTINVLKAAKEHGVGRLVLTSSISAIIPSPNWPADVVKTEDCWADVDYCRQKEEYYPLSKTLAEQAAWEFAKNNGVNMVVLNPSTCMGPMLPPQISGSMAMLLKLLQGDTEKYADYFMGIVHVKDVAEAQILLYENKSATGRHLCLEATSHFSDFAAKVTELYPEYKDAVPRMPKDTTPGLLRSKDAAKKLMDMGIKFTPMDQIIRDSIESLKSKGYLN